MGKSFEGVLRDNLCRDDVGIEKPLRCHRNVVLRNKKNVYYIKQPRTSLSRAQRGEAKVGRRREKKTSEVEVE